MNSERFGAAVWPLSDYTLVKIDLDEFETHAAQPTSAALAHRSLSSLPAFQQQGNSARHEPCTSLHNGGACAKAESQPDNPSSGSTYGTDKSRSIKCRATPLVFAHVVLAVAHAGWLGTRLLPDAPNDYAVFRCNRAQYPEPYSIANGAGDTPTAW